MSKKGPAGAEQETNLIIHSASYQGDRTKGLRSASVSRKRLRYRGIALVWTAIFLSLMLLLMGLMLDTGKVALNVHQLQNAADAAALGGAQVVKIRSPDATRQRTYNIGFANAAEALGVTLRMTAQAEPWTVEPQAWSGAMGDLQAEAWSPFDIVLGRWVRYNHTFVPTLDAPNAVMAIPRRNATLGATAPALSLTFGPMAGVDTADAVAVAVAWAYDSGGAGLICLSDPVPGGGPGLLISGTADIDIDGGGIHVNSSVVDSRPNKNGTWISGSALLDAGFINVVGGITPDPGDSDWLGIFEGGDEGVDGFSVMDYRDGIEYIPDPLAAELIDNCPYVVAPGDHLNLPALINNGIPTVTQTLEGTSIKGAITSSCTLGPGYYPEGLRLGNGNNVTLVPTSTSGLGTIFVFGGSSPSSGLVMSGGSLVGHGVTCYVTKNFSTGQLGNVNVNGGHVDLESPGDWQNEQAGTFDLSLVQGLNGIAIWQDPTMLDNKGIAPVAHFNGNGDFFISGTLYFPDPIHLRLEGDLGQAGNQILCGSAEIHGTANLGVNYDRRNEPGDFSRCFLVK